MDVKIQDGKIIFDKRNNAIGAIWRDPDSMMYPEWVAKSFIEQSKSIFTDYYSAIEYIERIANKW